MTAEGIFTAESTEERFSSSVFSVSELCAFCVRPFCLFFSATSVRRLRALCVKFGAVLLS